MIHLAPRYSSQLVLGDRHVTVKPGPETVYTQVLSQNETVKPADVHAVWFPERPGEKGLAEGIVVLFFQGGGFVTATDPGKTGAIPSRVFTDHLSSSKQVYTLWAQYRLARNEESRFPAALQDVVTFYKYLLDLGVPAENIIISGESAGGNLVSGLLRYIEETQTLPTPRGALAWSPWVDISEPALAEYKRNPRRKTDILNMGMIEWGVGAYPPLSRTAEDDCYLQPVEHPFSTKTPLVVSVGTAELLYHEVKVFSERMQNVKGNRIEYIETRAAPHDLLLNCYLTGLTGEAEHVAEKAGKFLRVDGSS
jgi:acetyl esterase/lipase